MAKAFLGDGLAWNWSIWKAHFPAFTPILDFIHLLRSTFASLPRSNLPHVPQVSQSAADFLHGTAFSRAYKKSAHAHIARIFQPVARTRMAKVELSYLYVAAKAVHPLSDEEAWDQYRVWMRGCWQGEVGQVLDELRVWRSKLGETSPDVPDTDPRKLVATTIGYLETNRSRMNYPEYRQGLPVTTARMESLVKQINDRVKGTEMFGNGPEGAEAILQVRAAALCDDDRLVEHLKSRPGYPFIRRPKPRIVPAQNCKS